MHVQQMPIPTAPMPAPYWSAGEWVCSWNVPKVERPAVIFEAADPAEAARRRTAFEYWMRKLRGEG